MSRPSKAECWDEFWAIWIPALADLHTQGQLGTPAQAA